MRRTALAEVQGTVNTHFVLLFTEIAKRAGIPDPAERARIVFERFRYGRRTERRTTCLTFRPFCRTLRTFPGLCPDPSRNEGAMSLKVCADPGCSALIPKGQPRCQSHERSKDKAIKQRDSERRKVYFTGRWKGLRRTVLRGNPWCQCDQACCPDGCRRLSQEVDHIIRIEDGGELWDRANLQALAKTCHSRKTARETWHAVR